MQGMLMGKSSKLADFPTQLPIGIPPPKFSAEISHSLGELNAMLH
jgi:hypothetical protein